MTSYIQTFFLSLQRLARRNGVKEEESNWYWDPSPQSSNPLERESENHYKIQIRALQDELSTLKERDTVDVRPEEELRRLREENKNLTLNLEDLDSQHQLAMEKLLTLKKELQKNFESLKQEHEDLKSANDEYSNEVKKLLAKIGDRDREIENIKATRSDHETLQHKYLNLERIHGLLRENAEKFQEENQELHEEVFKLQEKVTKLEHDIEVVHKQSETSDMVPRQTYDDLLKEINDLKDRRNSNQIHLDEVNIDDNAKSVIDSLRREITELKHKLSQKENLECNDNKIIRPEKVMQLYNKYVNFELPIDYVGEMPSAGDNIILFKLESVFKTVHSFKKDIDVLEHKLSEKNLNVNHLQTQIDDLTTENDFLTTDIRHVERELSEMKKNNDFLISEIAALKNTSKLEPIIETHEENNVAKLETELADCNKLNKNFESEIKRIEKELGEVRTEKISLKESLNDLRHKYTTMLSEFEMYKNQTKEVEDLENTTLNKESELLENAFIEIDDLKKVIESANAKNEQLSIDIHVLENDKELLKKQVADIKHSLEEKTVAYKELESHKSSLEDKINDLEEVVRREQAYNNTRELLEDKVALLERELISLNTTRKIPDVEVMVTETNLLSLQNSSLHEEIDKLKEKNKNLKHDREALLKENSELRSNHQEEIKSYQHSIEQLNTKIIEQDVLSNEVIRLKAENQQIVDRKVQLEAELSATDNKIVNLEQEFEKLVADLNEKDTLIDGLNSSLVKNQATLSNTNQTVTDLENSLSVKNEELHRIRTELQDVSHKLNNSDSVSNFSQEELKKLQHEKEEDSKRITSLYDEIQAKNTQISTLSYRLEELESNCTKHQSAVDNKDKEIKELRQSIVELTDKVNIKDNITQEDYAQMAQEKETLIAQLSEYRDALFLKERSLEELKEKHEQLEQVKNEFKTLVDNATTEKSELINLINLKHNESLQYHNEIQRLNGVIMEQTNEFKKIIEEKDKHIHSSTESCVNCDNLKVTLKEKDEIIIALNLKASEYDKMKADLAKSGEAASHLKERCENLDKSLAIQLEAVRTLTTQNAQVNIGGSVNFIVFYLASFLLLQIVTLPLLTSDIKGRREYSPYRS